MNVATESFDVVLVLCTAKAVGGPGELGAREIAATLVNERLCACVSSVPQVASCYRWEGELLHVEETLFMIKTTRAALQALQSRLLSLHPYEVPEFLVIPVVAGLPGYLQWVTESVEREVQ
ncbi:MAG: divalent-cation tolerance protein CutA [Planctomycetes bacterium]|nr:divalent-cation tolerance protein CutA [Planctomycetota bacterium]